MHPTLLHPPLRFGLRNAGDAGRWAAALCFGDFRILSAAMGILDGNAFPHFGLVGGVIRKFSAKRRYSALLQNAFSVYHSRCIQEFFRLLIVIPLIQGSPASRGELGKRRRQGFRVLLHAIGLLRSGATLRVEHASVVLDSWVSAGKVESSRSAGGLTTACSRRASAPLRRSLARKFPRSARLTRAVSPLLQH